MAHVRIMDFIFLNGHFRANKLSECLFLLFIIQTAHSNVLSHKTYLNNKRQMSPQHITSRSVTNCPTADHCKKRLAL